MRSDLETKMYRNIKLFGLYKVFTKRIFLPLTTIYASQAAGLSVAQIGLTTAIAAACSILFETTSGFWADEHGRSKSARLGAALAATGALLYVVAPSFWGVLAASVILSIGYSFLGGAIEALMHDSLIVLGRPYDYAKLASRAQALSLLINAGIVALVPLLYPIDKRLPFVIGFAAYLILYMLASLLTEPPVQHDAEENEKRFLAAVRTIVNRKTIFFFFMSGLMFACATGLVDLYNLGYVKVGIEPKYLGFMFAMGSLAGAILGLFIHKLKSLTFKQYASLDLLTQFLTIATLGFIRHPIAVVVAFIITMSFWRYETTMYQHYMLQAAGTTRYKATMLSVISNVRLIHEVWIGLAFTNLAHHIGVLNSIAYGTVLFVVVWPLLLLSIGVFSRNAKASLAVANQ